MALVGQPLSDLVVLCGDVMTMPGSGAHPAALDIDIDEHGRTVGLR